MGNYWDHEVYIQDVKASVSAIVHPEKIQGSKVLVTGATGLIGSFVVDVLLEMGCEVLAAGRKTDKIKIRFPKAKAVKYDLTSDISFNEDVDYIVHLAGYGHPAAFREDPRGVLMNSVNGTERMLEYAKEHCKKRFLFGSSGEVYGNVDSMTPRACYPIGKQAGETLCTIYKDKYDVDTVVVRICHTFGPGMSEGDNRAVSQFIRNAVNGEDIVLKSKGEQRRSYLYVADTASAILSVLSLGESGEAYDIAAKDSVYSISEMAKMIAEASGNELVFRIPDDEEKKQLSPINEQILNEIGLKIIGWDRCVGVKRGIAHTVQSLM